MDFVKLQRADEIEVANWVYDFKANEMEEIEEEQQNQG